MQVLYFYTSDSSFVKKDIEILGKKFSVKKFRFDVSKKVFLPLSFIKQKFFLLANIWNSSLVVCQFGGYHSFLPALFAKLFGKKSLIITGGVDCVSYPSFNYGYLHKFPLGIFTKWSYHLASRIAPKHESLIMFDDNYYGIDFPKQGIKYFMPALKTPVTVIQNGYASISTASKDKEIFSPPLGEIKRGLNSFLTVSSGFDYSFQMKLKGVDLIFEVAKFFPESEFLVVGGTIQPPTDNIKFLPPQQHEELKTHYLGAEFYLQLSISEGFPNALCEAMQCGCIPIVSDVGAMPEIVGDSGFILRKRNADLLKKLLEEAMPCDKKILSEKAKKRISENYSLKKREEKLLALAEKLAC